MLTTLIERLEPRIAPASLTGRTLKYVDLDGDSVTVAFSKGTLAAGNFTFDTAFGDAGPQQLQRIAVTGVADIDTANITVTVKRGPDGDGVAHVGEIIATGRDLGAVKMAGNLGKIAAGSGALDGPGIKSLSIGSYGIFFGATQPGGSNQSSTVVGDVGTLAIAGDFGGGAMGINGNVNTLKIGGSLVGGSFPSEGRLIVGGNLGKATVGGSLLGGSGAISGQLFVVGNAGSITVKGSLLGGSPSSDQGSGQIDVGGSAGSISILGDIRGPSGAGKQDSIEVGGVLGTLTVGGSVSGVGTGIATIALAHGVDVPGKAAGKVWIKGNAQRMVLEVGDGNTLGGTPVTLEHLIVGGSFLQSRVAVGTNSGADSVGGTIDDSFNAASVIKKLEIKGSLFGTVGGSDYFGILAGNIASAVVAGRKLSLGAGTQNLSVAPSGDVFARDVT
jgi:hypothetical protein